MSSSKKKKQSDGLSAGDNSVVIGGNVQGSNVTVGNNNVISNRSVNLAPLFSTLHDLVDKEVEIKPNDKIDVKAELKEIQTALEQPKPDETFLARRFRNIQRMAPDIVDVAFETLKNPISGVATVIQKIAKRMADEAGENK